MPDNVDSIWMREALAIARESVAGGGGPFGALIVRDGIVIGHGANAVVSTPDPTAHAEVVAIREAAARVGSFALTGATIYCSCEPCPMCLGAIYWARLARVFYAADRSDAAAAGFDDALLYDELPLPPDQRLLPFARGEIPAGRQVFDAWRAKTDRIAY